MADALRNCSLILSDRKYRLAMDTPFFDELARSGSVNPSIDRMRDRKTEKVREPIALTY